MNLSDLKLNSSSNPSVQETFKVSPHIKQLLEALSTSHIILSSPEKVAVKDKEIANLKTLLDQKARDLSHKIEELEQSKASVDTLNVEKDALLKDYYKLKKKEQCISWMDR